MHIKQAEYVASYVDPSKCPATLRPEFAFIGRSNVGKSSLINYLCNRKALTKVSNTPGKTQTINFFDINHSFHLVDLPGYGFAKILRSQRENWESMIKGYLKKREQLQYVMQLVDSRIPPQKIDLEFAAWLGAAHIPFVIIFTKADKPGSRETATNVQLFKNEMLKEWAELPPCFVTSAERKSGAEDVWSFVSDAVDLYYRNTPLANVSKG